MNIALDIDLELLQETLIALRDREHALLKEAGRPDVVGTIARRQLGRVIGAIAGIEDALQAATGARA